MLARILGEKTTRGRIDNLSDVFLAAALLRDGKNNDHRNHDWKDNLLHYFLPQSEIVLLTPSAYGSR